MIDWHASMQQTYEFYTVDPATWKNKTLLTKITSCTIDMSLEDETLASAKIDIEEDIGECYIRVYLVCIQGNVKEKYPLGTFLVQTPSMSFDGKVMKRSLDAYSPLLELKDSKPPLGYSLLKGSKVMENVNLITAANLRAPITPSENDDTVLENNFISDFNSDTWLSFLSDLMANAHYYFMLDELGGVLFAKEQRLASLRPKWEYQDDDISILKPEVTHEQDLYGVPNVVEVLCSTDTFHRFSRVENRDKDNPVSIPNRGREVIYRESNPNSLSNPSQEVLDSYAERLLESKSTIECRLTYKHGYTPTHIGDCVLINYRRAGLQNVRAKIVSQSISCTPGCEVTETAVYTKKIWEV